MKEKLDLKSKNLIEENIAYISERFPNVIKEGKIDFDILKQELSELILNEKKEKFELTWPGKRSAIVEANIQNNKTLLPQRDRSLNFDSTKNIYIEGDNLEVLKILQESYLNKIKLIYIDPPYNTGNDFIYYDNYKRKKEEELVESGLTDDYNNRLVTNTDGNGRFHSDWLSMMYSRIKLARNLLKEDGFIFISIDDNENANLRKICDEIFGEKNFLVQIVWQKRTSPDARRKISTGHEYILVYMKNVQKSEDILNYSVLDEKDTKKYNNPDNDPKGPWVSTDFGAQGYRPNQMYKIVTPAGKEYYPSEGRCWKNTEEIYKKLLEDGRMWFGTDGLGVPRKKLYLNEREGKSTWTWWDNTEVGHTQEATQKLTKLLGKKTIFEYSKPVRLLKKIVSLSTDSEDIVLDFFSGSGTTAEAVLELNATDNKNRRFIMVQIPEKCDEKSDAFKEGYKNICDIGEERIRRAGKKIKKETDADIDYGFRVYKVDSSNMKDVYYEPLKLNQAQLKLFESNIKEGRTAEDLLIQVILDLGLTLDLEIDEKNILNNKVYFVAGNSLVACFDSQININIINQICEIKPLKIVFRENSFSNDSDKINAYEKIKKLSPETEISVI